MKASVLCAMMLSSLVATLAQAGDRQDVAAIIEKYRSTEAADDMIGQGMLMTEDRVMIWPGQRKQGETRASMRESQDWLEKFHRDFPGVRYDIEFRDVEIRTWKDSAMVTFEWYPTRVVPATLPPEKVAQLDAPKIPMLAAHMLVKQEGVWKITFTTFMPLSRDQQL